MPPRPPGRLRCRTDLDATALGTDGKPVPVPFTAAPHPLADCFYVYPTVDMALVAGNHTDFADTSRMREVARAQVARFSSVCRVFVPLYRQMTIGTYFAPADEHQRRFETAYQDVLAAFRYYLAHFDDGRGIVLLGHSQGAQLVEKLLQTLFDDDPAMRARLVVAMPIGGDVDVATGSTRGGTFHKLPALLVGRRTRLRRGLRNLLAGGSQAPVAPVLRRPGRRRYRVRRPLLRSGPTRRHRSPAPSSRPTPAIETTCPAAAGPPLRSW